MIGNQKGFAQATVILYGAISFIIVSLIVAVYILNIRLTGAQDNYESEKAAHGVLQVQLKYIAEEYEKDYTQFTIALVATNKTWGSRYDEQIIRNNTLWDNNEWLREQNKYSFAKGQRKGIPENSKLVNCGTKPGKFASSFQRHHDRIYDAMGKLNKSIRENVAGLGTGIGTRLAHPLDKCILYRNNVSDWGTSRKLLDK